MLPRVNFLNIYCSDSNSQAGGDVSLGLNVLMKYMVFKKYIRNNALRYFAMSVFLSPVELRSYCLDRAC